MPLQGEYVFNLMIQKLKLISGFNRLNWWINHVYSVKENRVYSVKENRVYSVKENRVYSVKENRVYSVKEHRVYSVKGKGFRF